MICKVAGSKGGISWIELGRAMRGAVRWLTSAFWLMASLAPATAQAASFDAGGLSFSDELGGFRLLAASGSGRVEDPIVLVEELFGEAPAVLVVRRPLLAAQGLVAPSQSVLLRSIVKVVRNRSPWRWAAFELELRGADDRPSSYRDGLSFDQPQAVRGRVGADRFDAAAVQDEPFDRLRFTAGQVLPEERLRLAFELVDINPRSEFRLAQQPILLLAAAPARAVAGQRAGGSQRAAAGQRAGGSQRAAAVSSSGLASTQRRPAAVSSCFQNGALVFSQSIRKAQASRAGARWAAAAATRTIGSPGSMRP